MHYDRKRTWAEVNIGALRDNCQKIRSLLPKNCRFLALVKANAYGHGLLGIAQSLEDFGCDFLGVACFEEALQLRDGGVKLPILILSHTPSELICRVAELDCVQALGSFEDAQAYSQALENSGLRLRVHIKLETGMGRTGFNVKDGHVEDVKTALALKGIEAEGIFTHFAVADDPVQEDFTLRQFRLFTESVERIERESGVRFAIKHCANSAALISYPEMALDMVRTGIALYGIYPDSRRGALKLSPLMELKAKVLQVTCLKPGDTVSYGRRFTADREMTVAVISVGYGDGLHRCLSGKIDVLIHGKRCPQLGTICMDMCMIDVTGLLCVKPDDTVTIFGHDGQEFISVCEVAEKAETISYEILCGLTSRVPRSYNKQLF